MIVYDDKGKVYEYKEETCSDGFLVYPILEATSFSHWVDGHEEPCEDVSLGKLTVLEKIFYEKPVQKFDEELSIKSKLLKEKENQLSALSLEINRKQEELAKLNEFTADGILEEKLKELPEAKKFIKALKRRLWMYGIDINGVPYASQNKIIGIDMRRGKVVYLHSNDNAGVYKVVDYAVDRMYETQEDAEKAALYKLNEYGSRRPQQYEVCLKIDKLFDKYGIARSGDWNRYVESLLFDKTRTIKQDLAYNTEQIKHYQQMADDAMLKLEKLENYKGR